MQGRFMMSTQHNYAGIDIAKRNFVIAVSSLSKTKTETNNPKGIAHTVEYLKKHNVALVYRNTRIIATNRPVATRIRPRQTTVE